MFILVIFNFGPCFSIKSSLKDDDSGDHDQDQGSPKDSEKEKTEEDDKEQITTKKKVRHFLQTETFLITTKPCTKSDPCIRRHN